MNKIILAMALLVSFAFADVINLLSGEKIQNATVIEIDTEDVKFKIAEMDVIYAVRVSEVAVILYADGSTDIFIQETKSDSSNIPQKPRTWLREWRHGSEISITQRWVTFGTNIIVPGAGSLVFMNDVAGAVVQWSLFAGFYVFGILFNMCMTDPGSEVDDSCKLENNPNVKKAALIYLASTTAWNVLRSSTYERRKPRNAAAGKYGDFNMAVLPNERGDLRAYLLWNKEF